MINTRKPATPRASAHKLGRPVGTWSAIRHHYSKNQPLSVGFFLPVSPSAGAGSGLAATDAAAPNKSVSSRFPFSDPAHSLILRRTPPRLRPHWRGFPAPCSSPKPPSRRRPDPATGLGVRDWTDVPSDRHFRPVDHLVAVLDTGFQVLSQRLVVLLDLLDGSVNRVAEGVPDVLSPVSDPA